MPDFPIFNARSAIVEGDGTPSRTFYAFCRQVWDKLNKDKQANIAVPSGGEVVDVEARQAIEQIINTLEKYGITKEE